jgi:hypothetical protein
VEEKRYAKSTSHATQMNIQLNFFKDLNEMIEIEFFMNRDSLNYNSITALRIIFANLSRIALSFQSLTFALNIELIRSMQSEAAQATANDLKDCIRESVNEIEAQLALVLRGQENSKIYEEYRLKSELLNEFTLNVLQKKFIAKMSSRGFIWTAMELRDSFKYLTQLYLRVLRWINVTVEKNIVTIEVSYLSQYALVFLFIGLREN